MVTDCMTDFSDSNNAPVCTKQGEILATCKLLSSYVELLDKGES